MNAESPTTVADTMLLLISTLRAWGVSLMEALVNRLIGVGPRPRRGDEVRFCLARQRPGLFDDLHFAKAERALAVLLLPLLNLPRRVSLRQ